MTSSFRSNLVRQDGLAFVSLLFLMVFAGLAMASIYVMITPTADSNRLQLTRQRMDRLKSAALKFKDRGGAGELPSTLSALLTQPVGAADCSWSAGALQGWCGPYLFTTWSEEGTTFQQDAWGRAFQYTVGALQAGLLKSCGADGICGGGGSNDDLEITF